MALTDLLAGLKAEAAAEEAAIEVETVAEIARIGVAAQKEATRLKEQALRVVEDELRVEAEARRARARLAAAATVREGPGYPAVLRALLRESLAALPDAAVLRVDPRDERLAAELLGELGAKLEIAATLETAGGVELTRGDERVVRNTVEERLANAEPRLRLLFGRAQPLEAA